MPTDPNAISLVVGGNVFGGWMEMTVSRALDRLKSHFVIGCSDAWVTNGAPWQITPFSPCAVKIGTDTVLTGYVDEYAADADHSTHRVTITGGSKTGDLVECTSPIKGGQFKGYTLAQIARAICANYGIGVIVQADCSQIFPDATMQRCETDFVFLERLGRMAGVLLTDDAMGNLVLTSTGTQRTTDSLIQGQNLRRLGCKLNVEHRFSIYTLKGQRALGSTSADSWNEAPAAGIAPVVTNMQAQATDAGVPRFRPHTSMAEAQLDQAGMQRRVNWERNYAIGRATVATVTVDGWRQSDGTLWDVNRLVRVTAPFLQLDQDLLIAEVTYKIDAQGTRTEMRLGPVEGFTPDPGQVKLHVKKGKKVKGGGASWDGAGGA
jgi:prophage tail gpP-like protein